MPESEDEARRVRDIMHQAIIFAVVATFFLLVLGIVMGTMVEQSFVTSLIKSDGSVLPFLDRPVSSVLAAMTFAALLWPVFSWTRDWLRGRRGAVAA